MTPLLVNFDPLLELVYSWPLYEVIFNYLFLSVYKYTVRPLFKNFTQSCEAYMNLLTVV